ncbi:hypothetical protein FRB90_004291 [Tulasnella sp. 427]|nr:hypothetical protein FRB90_004291 [Tulasnella sp. 427]
MADQIKRRTRPCAYYQQGKCNRVPCNFSHDLGGLPLNGPNGAVDSSVSSQAPSIVTPPNASQASSEDAHHYGARPSAYRTKPCRFYAKGKCTAGDQCRWSHDPALMEELDQPEPAVKPGFKVVPASYRTLPCARFQMGHCFYGEDCNFIHTTPPQSTNASTPAANPPKQLGPSPPQLIHKAHSTHHSPAISPLNAPAIRNSISGDTVPSATLSAPTRPRELPPPVSHGGVNWSLPAIGTPGTPSKGLNTPPVFVGSPIITSGATEWVHPPVSRSNSLQPHQLGDSTNVAGSAPTAGRSPFLLTFGEIGPSGAASATNSPRGLGLNGANLVGPGNGSLRLGSPMLGGGSALGTTGIVARQRSRLSTSADAEEGEAEGGNEADAETEEPDFPSINYSDLNDLVTEPDEIGHPPHPERSSSLEFGSGPTWGAAPGEYAGPNGFAGHPNGTNGINGYGAYENDWGHALNMLQTPHHAPSASTPYNQSQQQNGHYGNGNGYTDQFRGGYKSRPCKFYVAGSRCPSGQNCTFIHDPEALRRPGPNGGASGALSPPPKPGSDKHPLYRTRECKYHLAGRCHQEGTCDFKHTGPPGQGREYENWEGFSIKVREHDAQAEDRQGFRSRPCKWFLKGNCFHGDNCTYLHDTSFPVRPPCHFFRNGTGHCMAGDNCRFSHDIQSPEDSEHQYGYDDATSSAQGPNGYETEQLYGEIPQVITSAADHQLEPYNEPYFGGGNQATHHSPNGLLNGHNLHGPLNGSGASAENLAVQGQRMELVVSEGEDDDEYDDVVVLKPSPKNDAASQDVEKLFASLSVAGTA